MFKIPERGSSKRALEQDRDEIMATVKKMKRSLKPKASFSSEYWAQCKEISQKMAKHTELQRKISLESFVQNSGGGETEWERTIEARELFHQLKSYQAEEKLYFRQEERVKSSGGGQLLRSYIELFTTSKIGLGVTSAGQGKRDSGLQSKFRQDLITSYNAVDPDPNHDDLLWDPVLKMFTNSQNVQAAHLFSYAHGQNTMDAIFGESETPELFSPLNGLILSRSVEDMMDKGFFAIVPNISDNASEEEVATWNASEPKDYKIRILDFLHPKIDKVILVRDHVDVTWRSLHDSKLEFKSSFRPRARYLYFHYCLQVLRLSWGSQQQDVKAIKKGLGNRFWGTRGNYVNKNMLRAFINELGHDYEDLMEGAMEEKEADTGTDQEGGEILLAVVLDQVTVPRREDESGEEDEDEDEQDSEVEDDEEK